MSPPAYNDCRTTICRCNPRATAGRRFIRDTEEIRGLRLGTHPPAAILFLESTRQIGPDGMTTNTGAPRRANGSTPEGDTYRAILTAARDVFRSQGFNEATVEDLRRAAGISRATFYFY